MQQIPKKIWVELRKGHAALGDTVWLCHELTALRLNFPDAIIQARKLDPRRPENTLFAPELNIEQIEQPDPYCIPDGTDFVFCNSRSNFSHIHKIDSKNCGVVVADWPALYTRVSRVPPKIHRVPWRYAKLKISHPDFVAPAAPMMPDIQPYQNFPACFGNNPTVTIQTGTSIKEKTYSMKRWEVVAKLFYARGFNVVYMGGPKDPQPIYTNDRIINMVGQGDLRDTIAMIRASDIHLAADTGTGHVAAAYGDIAQVSLFGGASHKVSSEPYGNSQIIRVIQSFKSLQHPRPNVPPHYVYNEGLRMHAINLQRKKTNQIQLVA